MSDDGSNTRLLASSLSGGKTSEEEANCFSEEAQQETHQEAPHASNQRPFQIPSTDGNPVEHDHTYVRQQLYNIIERSTRSLEELTHIAAEAQSPRHYEVVAMLTKTIADATDKLMKLHGDKRALTAPIEAPVTIKDSNIAFVGTTNDLLKAIRAARNGTQSPLSEPVEGEFIEASKNGT